MTQQVNGGSEGQGLMGVIHGSIRIQGIQNKVFVSGLDLAERTRRREVIKPSNVGEFPGVKAIAFGPKIQFFTQLQLHQPVWITTAKAFKIAEDPRLQYF